MRLLFDTHSFLWFIFGNTRLPHRAISAVDNAEEVLVSAATGYEMALKHSRGRLPEAGAVAHDVGGTVSRWGFTTLPLTMRHAEAAGRLPLHHRDPFDRMLAAQALVEGLVLLSGDTAFDAYGVRRLW